MTRCTSQGSSREAEQVSAHLASDAQLAMGPASARIRMSAADALAFGTRPMIATHDLHTSDLFTDAALVDLLDSYPRKNLYVLAMGSDPTRPEENRLALNEGVSGADLLRAVQTGRLWLNITRVSDSDSRYRVLVDSLYEQIAANVAGFTARSSQATLLVSSPGALVYYHADGPASVLWHVRGRKRVWVYPAGDARYVEREALEDIFVGARHEYLPFSLDLDRGASVYDLAPGQWIAWAQNAPHRVTNLEGVNVSLSTEHFTDDSRRRARVYAANRFFRTRLGCRSLSTTEVGAVALLKVLSHGLARKAGLGTVKTKRHLATMRVDPAAPGGAVPLVAASQPASPGGRPNGVTS